MRAGQVPARNLLSRRVHPEAWRQPPIAVHCNGQSPTGSLLQIKKFPHPRQFSLQPLIKRSLLRCRAGDIVQLRL